MANFTGTAGNDIFEGTVGPDEFRGLGGDDTYNVDIQTDLTFEFPNDGYDRVIASINYYLWPYVEVLILSDGAGDLFGVGNDIDNEITGNEGANLLLGGAGDDWIEAQSGNDTVYGEDGADLLRGGLGNDLLVGGSGADFLNGNEGIDLLFGGDGDDQISGAEGDDLVVGEEGNDFLSGNEGDDALYGGAGNDTLDGASGSDLLVGGGGQDNLFGFDDESTINRLYGGPDHDIYHLNAQNQIVFEQPDEGVDAVLYWGDTGYYLYDNVEALLLLGANSGISGQFGVGNAQDNAIIGDRTDNLLLGGGGNDIIEGRSGNDVLFGQDGADRFFFGSLFSGQDVIGDFQPGTDKLWFGQFAQNSVFASFEDAQSHFVQNGSDGAIDLGNGNFVVLRNVVMANLTASDFIFDDTPYIYAIGG